MAKKASQGRRSMARGEPGGYSSSKHWTLLKPPPKGPAPGGSKRSSATRSKFGARST